MLSVAKWPRPLTRLTSRWRCSTLGKVQLFAPFVRKLTRLYSKEMRKTVENQENLTLRQTMIDEFWWKMARLSVFVQRPIKVCRKGRYRDHRDSSPWKYHRDLKYSSGPNHSLASINLADNLKELGLEIGRFKTGTPPRVKASSINYDVTEIQPEMKHQTTSHTLAWWGTMSGIRCHAGWPTPMVPVMRLSKTTSTVRLCLQVWLREWASLLSINWGQDCTLCG